MNPRIGLSKAGLLLFSAAALSASCARAPDLPNAPDDPAGTAASALVGVSSFASDDGHLVQMASCGGDATCVSDVPMTGNPSPLFAEVDMAMRQFMKTHCVGSGVLAVSYKGRRVYKRGFGRMAGASMEDLPPHCSQDGYSSNVGYVLPDTDVNLGSVSKFITGSMVRDLVWQRIVERGLEGRYSEPTQALLLDPDLELLPPKILRYLDQTRPDAVCPPVAVTDMDGCARVPGCGSSGPDARWQQVTIGDLISHSAGLPKGSPEYRDTVANAGVLRGLSTAWDFYGEHLSVRNATPYVSELDDARQYLADTAGVDVGDVYFVRPWGVTGLDAQPMDDLLTMIAGRCLLPAPNGPRGQSDTNPMGKVSYANAGFAFLERVIAHLHPAPRFAAFDGEPQHQGSSALQQFLEDEGLGVGVQNEYAMFPRQKMDTSPGGPQRRAWDATQLSYAPQRASLLRPFCIWNGSTCDFDAWAGAGASHDVYRLRLDFATNGVGASPPRAAFELQEPYLNPGTGNIAVEAPALLKLAGTYFMGARNDNRLGKRRATCSDCDVTGYKDGDAGGTKARLMTLVGGAKNATLPPRDAAGRLTIAPDVATWTTAGWTDASDVDFIVSVHQSEDEVGGGDGYGIESWIRYGLSRVDWAAVDRMVKRQRMSVVGVGINNAGNSYYWFEDEHKTTLGGLPKSHDVTPAAALGPSAPLPESGGPGGQAPPPAGSYSLPSTRIGSDIVAVDISSNDVVYAWYDDGHVSAGNSGNLSAHGPAWHYSVPSGYAYNDIVGVAITSGNTVVYWFRNGKVATGTSSGVTSSLSSFTLPPGQAMNDIVDMAVNKANDHTFTVFKDGSVAEGTYYDLDHFAFRPGQVLGMAMQNGDTTIWYQSGYRKELDGSPADNRLIANVQPTSDYFRLPVGFEYTQVAGIARPAYYPPRLWFKNGARSVATTTGDFLSAGAAGATTWPVGDDGNTAVAFASHDGITYSWFNTGRRAKGGESNLTSVGQWSGYGMPSGQHEFTVDAITVDTGSTGDGYVWTLFRDGAIARGHSNDLDSSSSWLSPHANPIP